MNWTVEPGAFQVSSGGKQFDVIAAGFKRRVVYAPLKKRDLRIGNQLYLQLASPIKEGEAVEVKNPDVVTAWEKRWPPVRER